MRSNRPDCPSFSSLSWKLLFAKLVVLEHLITDFVIFLQNPGLNVPDLKYNSVTKMSTLHVALSLLFAPTNGASATLRKCSFKLRNQFLPVLCIAVTDL